MLARPADGVSAIERKLAEKAGLNPSTVVYNGGGAMGDGELGGITTGDSVIKGTRAGYNSEYAAMLSQSYKSDALNFGEGALGAIKDYALSAREWATEVWSDTVVPASNDIVVIANKADSLLDTVINYVSQANENYSFPNIFSIGGIVLNYLGNKEAGRKASGYGQFGAEFSRGPIKLATGVASLARAAVFHPSATANRAIGAFGSAFDTAVMADPGDVANALGGAARSGSTTFMNAAAGDPVANRIAGAGAFNALAIAVPLARAGMLGRGGAIAAESGGSSLPVVFDGEFATQQLLGTTTTPGGRQIMFHAADRMVNPPAGRVAMTPAQIDEVLDGATRVVKRSYNPMGDTLTIRNANMPGRPEVVVDAATGTRVITVIKNSKR